MRSIRIGVDARPLLHPKTGIGRYLAEIVNRLQSADHRLFLYGGTGKPKRWTTTLAAQLRYPQWVEADRLDVFWSPRHHLPLRLGVPSVVTIHDMVWRRAPETMQIATYLMDAALMPLSLRRASAIVAVSQSTRSDLLQYYPGLADRISVIPEAPFVTPEDLSHEGVEAPAVGNPEILFVGTFEARKNLDRLLQAFARLIRDPAINHKLVLAGRKGWKVDVPQQIETLGLGGRVVIHENVDDDALAMLYGRCEFLVLPSIYEGFGLPLVEAMAFGKPVVTSSVSSMPEVGGEAALLVDPYSVESIEKAMHTLIENRRIYLDLSSKARQIAAGYSWDRAAAETLDVLESVAE